MDNKDVVKDKLCLTLTREQIRAIQLLAGMVWSGDVNGLVLDAVKRYPKQTDPGKCPKCGTAMRTIMVSQEFDPGVKVYNLPGSECPQCGERLGAPVPLLAELENVAAQMPSGTEIDLNEILRFD